MKPQRATSGFIMEPMGSDWWTLRSHHPHECPGLRQDWWTQDRMRITRCRDMGYKRQARRALQSFRSDMERQATQPAAVPTGRKRRRVSSSKKAPDMKATRELEMALNALPRAETEETPASQIITSNGVVINQTRADPPPTPSPIVSPVSSVNDLMEGTLKDYEEECLEEGTCQAEPAQEDQDLDQMETQLNELLYETCPFHPHRILQCVNPDTQFGQLRFKCPLAGYPVYLFEDSREMMMEKLKEDTHPQVRARLQRGELKCKCGLVPRMKLSRTSKNYQKVFFSCGSFLSSQDPCGYFQWLHGPLWSPREQAQPTLRRWVKETPPEVHDYEKASVRPWGMPAVPLLKKHCLDEASPERDFVERHRPWANQFKEAIQAQERAYESRRHLHKNFGSSCLF